MLKNIVISMLCTMPSIILTAQNVHAYPEVGKPCPDFFLKEVYQFRSNKAALQDFKGKPLIIDFFEQYCAVCFRSFPKINLLQQEFKDSLQFLLVGYEEGNIRQVYNRFQKHFDIHLPVAYDTVIANQFQLVQFPYVVWIDSAGIVRAVTTSEEINQANLQKLIHGVPLNLPLAKNKVQFNEDVFYNFSKPLLAGVNSANDSSYLFRSMLMKWTYRQGFNFDANLNSRNIKTVQGVGYPLFSLYKEAYGDTVQFDSPIFPNATGIIHYGSWYLYPVVEGMSDSLFQYDLSSGKNLFSYYLSLPGATSVFEMQQKMRADLKAFFNMDVKIEKRPMPCWRLTATENTRRSLITKGGSGLHETDFSHLKLVNKPVNDIIGQLWIFNQDDIFIDDTGIKGNIDIEINCIFTDFEDFRKQLQVLGLELVKSTKEMNTLVFRPIEKFD